MTSWRYNIIKINSKSRKSSDDVTTSAASPAKVSEPDTTTTSTMPPTTPKETTILETKTTEVTHRPFHTALHAIRVNTGARCPLVPRFSFPTRICNISNDIPLSHFSVCNILGCEICIYRSESSLVYKRVGSLGWRRLAQFPGQLGNRVTSWHAK